MDPSASLDRYRAKRDFGKTPEPATDQPPQLKPTLARFVVQEHHATSLHWDFRLERDGVLVSWAVPKGVPPDPRKNHLAVHVEDHPLSYIDFEGTIPEGNYGAGTVSVWDQGTYDEHKWTEREVMVTLHGLRVEGRYVLFQTGGKNWMIHRMDPPQDAKREPMPEAVEPMKAKLADDLPRNQHDYGFEFKWDGIRATLYNEGGRIKLLSRTLEDITRRYPELRELGEALGAREVVLDGEVIAVNQEGRPSFERLQERMGLSNEADVRRKMREVPVGYMIFDLLYLDGRSTLGLEYRKRRRLLEGLKLKGRYWQTPESVEGDGETMRDTSRIASLEGIMAKRLDSIYQPGRRSDLWLKVKNWLGQELVIGGWLPGEGAREGRIGALLIGYYEEGKLVYAGKVGTGFTEEMLTRLAALLGPLRRLESPFERGIKAPKDSIYVEPRLVGEFRFAEWTRTGQLRHPAFKGLRDDKDPRSVVRENT